MHLASCAAAAAANKRVFIASSDDGQKCSQAVWLDRRRCCCNRHSTRSNQQRTIDLSGVVNLLYSLPLIIFLISIVNCSQAGSYAQTIACLWANGSVNSYMLCTLVDGLLSDVDGWIDILYRLPGHGGQEEEVGLGF